MGKHTSTAHMYGLSIPLPKLVVGEDPTCMSTLQLTRKPEQRGQGV